VTLPQRHRRCKQLLLRGCSFYDDLFADVCENIGFSIPESYTKAQSSRRSLLARTNKERHIVQKRTGMRMNGLQREEQDYKKRRGWMVVNKERPEQRNGEFRRLGQVTCPPARLTLPLASRHGTTSTSTNNKFDSLLPSPRMSVVGFAETCVLLAAVQIIL